MSNPFTTQHDITYRELIDYLKTLPEEVLDFSITIYDSLDDEFFGVNKIDIQDETDDVNIIEAGTPILTYYAV